MKAALYKTISLLILGFILGSALTSMYIGYRLDNLTLANRALQDELADAHQKLTQLKEITKTPKKPTISSVETFLLLDSREDLTDYDKITVEFEANKKVKEWLNPIVGQDVSSLDSLLIPRIVDNREIEANGNRYRLRTYLVVVNRTTAIYIKATLIKPDAVAN